MWCGDDTREMDCEGVECEWVGAEPDEFKDDNPHWYFLEHDGAFRPRNDGTLLVGFNPEQDPDATQLCEALFFEPTNTGNITVNTHAESDIVFMNVTNAFASEHESLLFMGHGNVTVYGGISNGHGSMMFNNTQSVVLTGLYNDARVSFDKNREVIIADVVNHGHIEFNHTGTGAGLNITNYGAVNAVHPGQAVLDDVQNYGSVHIRHARDVAVRFGEQSGDVVVSGCGMVTIEAHNNYGTITVKGENSACECHVTVGLVSNPGTVRVLDGAVVLVHVAENSGTIDMQGAGMASSVSVQHNSGTITEIDPGQHVLPAPGPESQVWHQLHMMKQQVDALMPTEGTLVDHVAEIVALVDQVHDEFQKLSCSVRPDVALTCSSSSTPDIAKLIMGSDHGQQKCFCVDPPAMEPHLDGHNH
jgi:hypothetical protein